MRGTATRADRARTAVRRAASAGVLTVAGIARTPVADAAGGRPKMVSRAQWGASRCQPRNKPDYGEVDAAVVHHTVNANDYSRSEAPDVVLGICLFHRNTNGWSDIGYNFLVDRYGRLYEGRAGGSGEAVIGAQAQGVNAQTTGIANLGTYSATRQSGAALQSMARLIRWKLPLHGAPTTGSTTLTSSGGSEARYPAGRRIRLPRVIGHRDVGSTSCPGSALYAQLGQLRRLVGSARLDPNRALITARSSKSVALGRSARIRGDLRRGDDAPIPGAVVSVDARVGRRWKPLTTARTATDGRFSARFELKNSRQVRARFAGAGAIGAAGERVAIGVRPRISLADAASAAAIGARVTVRGRIEPRKRSVFQVLQQRRGGRYRTVGTTRLRVSSGGRFRGSFVPVGRSRYRYYVVSRADRRSARGRSERQELIVGRRGGGGVGVPGG